MPVVQSREETIHNRRACAAAEADCTTGGPGANGTFLYATLVTRQQWYDRVYAKHQKSRSRDARWQLRQYNEFQWRAGRSEGEQCPFKCDARVLWRPAEAEEAFFFHGGICAARKSRERCRKSGCGRAVAESTTVPAWLAVPAAVGMGRPNPVGLVLTDVDNRAMETSAGRSASSKPVASEKTAKPVRTTGSASRGRRKTRWSSGHVIQQRRFVNDELVEKTEVSLIPSAIGHTWGKKRRHTG